MCVMSLLLFVVMGLFVFCRVGVGGVERRSQSSLTINGCNVPRTAGLFRGCVVHFVIEDPPKTHQQRCGHTATQIKADRIQVS